MNCKLCNASYIQSLEWLSYSFFFCILDFLCETLHYNGGCCPLQLQQIQQASLQSAYDARRDYMRRPDTLLYGAQGSSSHHDMMHQSSMSGEDASPQVNVV